MTEVIPSPVNESRSGSLHATRSHNYYYGNYLQVPSNLVGDLRDITFSFWMTVGRPYPA